MPDVSKFIIGGETINVKDETARTQSSEAKSTADKASTNASSALQKITEIENLSRVEISYSDSSETITITTGNHQ